MTPPLSSQVAWVTGASRGIGRAIANSLAGAGAHVILGARTVAALDLDVEAFASRGLRGTALSLDVRDPASVAAFEQRAVDLAGPPDILVNNAGVGTFRPIDEFTDDEIEAMLQTNLHGTIRMVRAAYPHMKRQGRGNIINISSLAGEFPFKGGSAYVATKFALNGFTQSLMMDAREHGIRVTQVCPGSVDTRFHLVALPNAHPRDQEWMLEPADVAHAVLLACTLPPHAMLTRLDVRPTQVPPKDGLGRA